MEPAIFRTAVKRCFCGRQSRFLASAAQPCRHELTPRPQGRVRSGLTDVGQRCKSTVTCHAHPGASGHKILTRQNSRIIRPPLSWTCGSIKKFVSIRSDD
jgi:hypothetical protein